MEYYTKIILFLGFIPTIANGQVINIGDTSNSWSSSITLESWIFNISSDGLDRADIASPLVWFSNGCNALDRDCPKVVFSTTFGCPRGWVKSNTRCYKFVEDDPRIFAEADSACWKDGATLLSINTDEEHTFISSWLAQNDILPPSVWLTSGYLANGMVIWEGDDSRHSTGFYWLDRGNQQKDGRVAYAFGGAELNSYGWTLVSDSTPVNYICEISQSDASSIGHEERDNAYGYGLINPKEIPRGPEIISQPESIIIVEDSLSVYIECTSSGNPYPAFSWFRGDNLNESVTSATNSRYTLSGGRFTIVDPKNDDVNSYRCLATNEIGTVMSKIARVQFGYLREFPPQPDADVYARAFRGVRLECNTPSYYPEVRFEWSKFGTAAFVSPGHSYQFVSMAGYLYMSEVQPTDGKKYFCFVTLTAPNSYKLTTKQPPTRISLGVWLRISEDTYVSNYGPIINTHAFPSPALRGLTVRLECIAYGTLPMRYAWKRTGDLDFVPGTKISDRGRVLTIVNAPLDAEGGYICTATGKGGVAHKTISLVMETEPYFPYEIGNKFVDPGQSVKWRCKAVARPKATYAWYKNGNLLQTVPDEIEVRGQMLYIKSVRKERDEGMYQCGATNLHGTTFSTGRLKVVSFKPNFDKHPLPPITLAPVGGTITIPCRVEAAPAPQVSWLKNGADLNLFPGVSGRITMLASHELVLSEINYSDVGTYTCEASNVNGEAFNRTYLTVVEGVVITTPPTPTTVRVNNTAFLYCNAAYDSRYDVTYTWKFNGHPIDFHMSSEYVLGQSYGTYGLYITQAQFKNSGIYECVAETSLDATSKSTTLMVTGTPGPPAGVYTDSSTVTAYTARLMWTVGRGTDHGDPIRLYDVEGETHYRPGDWKILASDIPEHRSAQEAIDYGGRADQRSVRVHNLLPYTAYRFRVRAINGYGRGKEASQPSAIVQTPETLPVVVPRNVGGGGGKVGTLSVEWDPLDISEHCGPGLGYNIFWKRYGDNRSKWRKDTVTNEREKTIVTREGETKVTFTATVGLDNYYIQYEVKVGAFNIHGDGPNSTVTVIYSAEGMPLAVPKIQDTEDVNSTAAIINWIPVPDNRETMKGRVLGYTVQYFEADDDFSPSATYEPDNIMTKEIYGQTDHCKLIGLKPDTDYYARVQVFNTAGRGPKGHWRVASTTMNSPKTRPTFVKVYPRTEHSVTITWRGVSIKSNEESLLGYKLFVWKVPEDMRSCTQTQVDKVTKTVLHGLQKKTVYALRVLAYSGGGNGRLSELVHFTVLGGTIPLDPTSSLICYPGDSSKACSSTHLLQPSVFTLLVIAVLSKLLISLG